MQEGTVAFLQMVKIAAAVELHKQAHLPYLVYLRHPTTGGVFASWGSLGHVTAAEPGALIGFLGPRVYEHLYGEPFPTGVQTAENLHRHGVIDGVVPLELLRSTLDRALKVVSDAPGLAAARRPTRSPSPTCPRGIRSRPRGVRTGPASGTCCDTGRPSGCCSRGPAATARRPPRCWRWPDSAASPRWWSASSAASAADWPARRRCARRAAGWRWPPGCGCRWSSSSTPPGPALSAEAEEGGLAGEIARCLAELVTLDTPTVSVLLGQGSGGPALAMVPADRVLAALHGWLAPLPPEGASAIVFRDVDHAPELAAAQGIRSADLLRNGIVDAIVPEHTDAADTPLDFTNRLSATIAAELRGAATPARRGADGVAAAALPRNRAARLTMRTV